MTTDFFKDQQFSLVERDAIAPRSFAFTVDVEEWFQVGAFENTLSRRDWPELKSRVVFQTHRVLNLLDDAGIKATFFCLGWVGEREPALIREIYDRGHEIGCHGTAHQRIFTFSQSEFREDIENSKKTLEDATGVKIRGYRAPSFSLTPDVWWAYEELLAAGFDYSSSLYPVKTDHYGAEHAPRRPFYPLGPSVPMIEIPMTVCDTPLRRMPASGGGYFRLLPYALSRYMFRTGVKQARSPALFYCHPWEFDPDQPYVKDAPLLSRFRHYTGQSGLPTKLKRLFKDFTWSRMDDVYADILPQSATGA